MEVRFLSDDLKELYEKGYSRKYRKVPPEVVKKLPRAVDVLSAAVFIQDIWKFPAYKFEHLEGSNRYSMRLNITWRLEMEITWTNDECTIGIIGLDDLTHHYGD